MYVLINEHLFFFALPLAAAPAIVYSQNEFPLVSPVNVFLGATILRMMYIFSYD